jgi:hypothetical protein
MIPCPQRRRCTQGALTVAGTIVVASLLFPATWNVTHAAPPPDADPQRHLWFERQRSVAGIWCCNTADGHVLDDGDWRATSEHYEVRLAGTWFVVPAHALRDPRGGPNMIGRAVVWYVIMEAGVHIMCFAPGWSG